MVMEDALKSIISIFDKVFKKNKYWAVLYIFAISFGLLCIRFNDNVWIATLFMVSCVGAIFHLSILILTKLHQWGVSIKTYFSRKKNHNQQVWTSVKFLNREPEILEMLTKFFDFENLDGDKYTICIYRNFKPNSKEERGFEGLLNVASIFGREYGYLIEIEHVRGGTYFHFDKYFFRLIKHYRKKKRWEKLLF